MIITASDAIIQQLAVEQRRVLSAWRALILLRRATFQTPPPLRRWSRLPSAIADVRPVLRQMLQRGEISPLPKLRDVYEVTVPYAQRGSVSEYEILMEVNPYSALVYLSAMRFHQLTEQLPKEMQVSTTAGSSDSQLPPDTLAEDWLGVSSVEMRRPKRILNTSVRWFQRRPSDYFGIHEYHPQGFAVRVTTVERTLLDGLLHPELCGGIENVLRAWTSAQDFLNIAAIVANTERFDIGILRQRVGFTVETLGMTHPVLDCWSAAAPRGGSSKLVAALPYASTYSERWNLSINAPVDVLSDDIL